MSTPCVTLTIPTRECPLYWEERVICSETRSGDCTPEHFAPSFKGSPKLLCSSRKLPLFLACPCPLFWGCIRLLYFNKSSVCLPLFARFTFFICTSWNAVLGWCKDPLVLWEQYRVHTTSFLLIAILKNLGHTNYSHGFSYECGNCWSQNLSAFASPPPSRCGRAFICKREGQGHHENAGALHSYTQNQHSFHREMGPWKSKITVMTTLVFCIATAVTSLKNVT